MRCASCRNDAISKEKDVLLSHVRALKLRMKSKKARAVGAGPVFAGPVVQGLCVRLRPIPALLRVFVLNPAHSYGGIVGG